MTTDNTLQPRVIPRSQHPISRKNIDREALKVLYRLRDAGHTAYLVGGGVRDLYLNRTPKDFDISTSARPGQLRKLFRNSRIIGRRFRLVQVFFHGGKVVEVSTFRCRSEYDLNDSDQVLPSNNSFGTAAEDAFRRDLTINSLFYEIENFTILDYTGGVEDLDNRIVRMVGDPDRRIIRDPVRIMRAVRHAARSGFTIEPETWRAIKEHRHKLSLCPVSRIRDELFKDLRGGASRPWAELALNCGLLFNVLPFYEPLFGDSSRASQPIEEFLKLLGVIDRLHQENRQVPEPMLLAALLTPWANHLHGLFAAGDLKGNEAFAYGRTLRNQLDEALLPLNIKRACKETITMLLTSLPVFVRHGKQKDWPRRLRQKSYFEEGLLLYRIYLEATSGDRIEIEGFNPAQPPRPKPRTRPPRRGSRAPAFSRAKGGVFGFGR